MGWRSRLIGAVSAAAAVLIAGGAGADSGINLTLEEYLERAGDDVRLVEPGETKIDGHTLFCGTRPTVIDPNFGSWGGAYPGFLILNPERMKGLPTAVKLFIYAHECGHQFVGRDEEAADCFGVKRGRRYGWLTERGLDQVCTFISGLKADSVHAAGPDRCEKMRACYKDAAPRASRE